jgi:hypothetical protein
MDRILTGRSILIVEDEPPIAIDIANATSTNSSSCRSRSRGQRASSIPPSWQSIARPRPGWQTGREASSAQRSLQEYGCSRLPLSCGGS